MAISRPCDVGFTDSQEYADIAKSYGAVIPFLRPDILSTDNASSVDVVLHAMIHAEKLGEKYDAIGLLEPTSPFITSKQLSESLMNYLMIKMQRTLLQFEASGHIFCTREIKIFEYLGKQI